MTKEAEEIKAQLDLLDKMVKARQTLVVLESMKIELLIEAPYAGRVERVFCRPGETVAEGAPLVELEAG